MTDRLVQYRMDRAFEVLQDAKILANAKRWKSCVNRLYYSEEQVVPQIGKTEAFIIEIETLLSQIL